LSRKVLFRAFFVLIICNQLFLSQSKAFGQMQDEYPKRFSFSGLVELTYKDYNTEIKNRRDVTSGYSVLQHKYSLAAKGYIYHPKLAIFSSRVTFLYNDTFNSTSAFEPDSKDMTYELKVVVLPYRPISLSAYAIVNDFSVDSFSWGNPLDNEIINYGGTLGINLKNYPTIRFDYYHLEVIPTGSQTNKETSINDSYYLMIKGTWLKIKTQYALNVSLMDIHNAQTNLQSKYVDLYTNTAFSKFSWINFLKYNTQNNLKLYGIYTNLQFNRWQKFFSDYLYSFEHQESSIGTRTTTTDKQELRASLSYKFSPNLQASVSLNYGAIDTDDSKSKFKTVSLGLHYSRPIKSNYFTAFYRFTVRDDTLRISYSEHTASLQLTSKSYKWGTFFTTYYFSTIDGTFKFKIGEDDISGTPGETKKGEFRSMTNNFVVGLRGRVWNRATWLAEAQYVHSTAHKSRPVNFVDYNDLLESDTLVVDQKKDYCVLVAELYFPIGKRGTMVTFRAGDDFGNIDSESFDRKYYELHVNWPVSRRIRLTSWWRESWYDISNTPLRKIRDYSVLANYRIGKIFIDGEYWVRQETQESHFKRDTRLILKGKRYF
jgi:hypothetical protein